MYGRSRNILFFGGGERKQGSPHLPLSALFGVPRHLSVVPCVDLQNPSQTLQRGGCRRVPSLASPSVGIYTNAGDRWMNEIWTACPTGGAHILKKTVLPHPPSVLPLGLHKLQFGTF